MRFPGRRARISVLISALLLLGLLVPVVDQFFFRYEWANTTLEDVDRRYARLLGLRDAGPEIAKALGQARAELVRHAYPLDLGPDRVGADLQKRVRQIAERAVGPAPLPLDDCYRMLGLAPSVSDDELTRAWRRLLAQHHPDKLQGQGADEAALKAADARTRELRAAYERIVAARAGTA